MATIGEYFDTEARDCIAQLERELERPLPNPAELHRAARALRGSAQMAREERMTRAAGALEAATRALLDRTVHWSDDVAQRAQQTVADLRTLLDQRNDEDTLQHTTDSVVTRWRSAGVATGAQTLRLDGATPSEFRAFAAREVSAIIDALENGVQQLTSAPMDRAPLKMILRRQRALLGAARLDEVPVVAEVLRAVDDLTRVIARLDVGVKRKWLDIYRVAREALKAAIEPLLRDENPAQSHSLARLRHMRAELLERYGSGDAVSPAHTSEGFTTATVQESAPPVYIPETRPAAPSAPAEEPLLLAEADVIADAEPELVLDDVSAEPELLLEDESDQDVLVLESAAAESEDEGAALLLLTDEADASLDHEAVLELEEELLVLEPDAALESDDVLELAAADVIGNEAPSDGNIEPTEDVVPIEALLYDRETALRRAMQLRDILVRDDATDEKTRAALDELFDLINLALH